MFQLAFKLNPKNAFEEGFVQETKRALPETEKAHSPRSYLIYCSSKTVLRISKVFQCLENF
jgi:hypothetical protein